MDEGNSSAILSLHSPAGEMGYPGTVEATCSYELRDDDVLAITMTAVTDAPTPINLAHHSYWNLAGHGSVYHHLLQVDAEKVLEVDADTIPTGNLLDTAGSKLDFTEPRPIGPGGEPFLDHCYVLRDRAAVLRFAARLLDPSSGRTMEVWTNQPALQVYSGYKLATTGRDGATYRPGSGAVP